MPKITIIGGGSSIFVPPLIRSLIKSTCWGPSVTLMDVDEGRVRVMEALARKLIDSERSLLRSRARSIRPPRSPTPIS